MTIETMGGYRVIRKLGEGERAEVYLGYPQSGAGGAPMAIKVLRSTAAQESIMVEIEALTRAAGEHCVRLVDLASGTDGTYALILERLTGGSLARLLASRTRLLLGEAITVLAPLAATLARLHSSGVAHRGVGPETIMFSADGAPTLIAFGSAALISPDLPSARLDAEADVMADRDAFALLARSVLLLVRDEGAADLADWIASAPRVEEWWDRVESRLFELGEPCSVDLSARAAVDPQPVPTRALTATPVTERAPAHSHLLDSLGLPAGVTDAVAPLLLKARVALARVRKPVWFAVIASAAALVVALALVPTDSPDATADSPPPARVRAEEHSSSAAGGDDPVQALTELLETREECFRAASVLCLDSVGQPGSSALSTDQQRVRGLQAGESGSESGGIAISADRLILTERLGDSALVEIDSPANGEPASILLMKGEAGWRIRDYLDQ